MSDDATKPEKSDVARPAPPRPAPPRPGPPRPGTPSGQMARPPLPPARPSGDRHAAVTNVADRHASVPSIANAVDRHAAIANVAALVEEEVELEEDLSDAPPPLVAEAVAQPTTAVLPVIPQVGGALVGSLGALPVASLASRPVAAPEVDATSEMAPLFAEPVVPAVFSAPMAAIPAVFTAPTPAVVPAPPISEAHLDFDSPTIEVPAVFGNPPPVADEARASRRLPFEINVDIVSEHNFYAGLSLNISEGGLFVATHVEYPVGTQLEIRLLLPGDEDPTSIMTEVRWTRPHNENADGSAGMGLRFLGLTPEVLAKIAIFAKSRDPLYYEDD